MINTNETLADILREMRDRAITKIGGRTITERNFVPQETVEDWADRIEAAAEREVLDAATTLDASALRKALAGLVSAVMDYHENAIKYVGKDMMRVLADPINRAQEALCSSGDSGNVAKLREALDEIRVAAMSDYEPDADYLIDTCNAALSAPARNCDRFADWMQAWDGYSAKYPDARQETPFEIGRFHHWLFAKAEGGAE